MWKKLLIAALAVTFLGKVSSAQAHAGHPEDVTIRPSTHPHLQAIITPYLAIASSLRRESIGNGYKQAAGKIKKEAAEALARETNDTGRQMLKGMINACGMMLSGADLSSARKGFAELNKQFLPFFKSWQSHLKEHGLIMYLCYDGYEGWMQKAGDPKTPYGNHPSDYGKFQIME
ncbi:MAG: hypothetical protein ACE5GM_11055 [bacterium]